MYFSVIEENLHLKIALQRLNRERNTNFTYLKPLQSVCIMQTYEREVISALKTGYGKSLIFESLAYYKTGNTSPTIIIVSPLNAIINEQLERNGKNAIQVTPEFVKTLSDHKCSDKCDLSCSVKRFRTADFKFILVHPEHFMEKVVFNNFLTPV